MDNKEKQLTLTVAIPTCYGGESLSDTAKGLRNSKGVGNFRFIICADRTPISPEIKSELSKLGVELIWNEKEGSQLKKIKQTVDVCNSDIYVSTQDDITFEPGTLKEILSVFQSNPEATMVGARVLPLPPETFFESAMASMVRVIDHMVLKLKGKSNHLLASGRCLAFRTEHFKRFNLRENIVTGDMYMYLENRRLGGRFALADKAIVKIRCPQKISDQVGPSSRYQYALKEMVSYFGQQVAAEYKIPIKALVLSFLEEFIRHPISLVSYMGVFIYTRLNKQPEKKVIDPVWDVDTSTKQVNK